MTTSLTNEQRIYLVQRYRCSGLTQEAFCTQLRASEGFGLAPRTLRAWCRRFDSPANSTDACVQIVSQAIQGLQDILEELHAANLTTAVPGANQASPAPASGSEAPKELASPSLVEPASAVPPGMPRGNAHSPIEFMPTVEPSASEPPRSVRRKGILWELG